MTLSGHATLAGTSRYVDRFGRTVARGHFRPAQQLLLSSIGIGTYLGEHDAQTDERYEAAIVRAVEIGTNLIDSAANYRFQRSERSIGSALQRLADDGYQRDEIVICTKGGYLPFDSVPPTDVRGYIEETFVRTGVASLSDFVGGSHCMTPSYLKHQLTQSLANLQLETIDVYYVHNPESQLGAVSEEEFYERLQSAFTFLEEARRANQIKMYGVATWNGFRTATESRQFHSLPRMVELAKAAGGESHGFRFIQLPFNLGMPEALTLRNQVMGGQRLSTLEAATTLGVTVVASASILQGRVAQGLSDQIRRPLGNLSTDAQTAIQFVRSTPGLTTALVGMSSIEHVEENLHLTAIEPRSEEDFLKLFSAG